MFHRAELQVSDRNDSPEGPIARSTRPSHSVVVPMMSAGKMAMAMLEGRMSMQVAVSGISRLGDVVTLLVVLVMFVLMSVLQWLVTMGVRMMLGKMEPHASCH